MRRAAPAVAPARQRGLRTRPAVSTIFNWAANFVVSYFFLQQVALIGQPLTFWIYAVPGLLAIGFVWWKVPETKDKSLEQIEREVGAAPSADR